MIIESKEFSSRIFMGTGKFGSSETMIAAVKASGTELVTVSIKRLDLTTNTKDDILTPLQAAGVAVLPNTAGARTAEEAVLAAKLAREALQTNWIKVEVHPDVRYLMPDPVETLEACRQLVVEGFVVLPYCHADPVLCKRLEEVGCAAVMPLGAPIGSHMGIRTEDFLHIIIEQSYVPVIIDAGLGRPSDASFALEIGADGVLVNSAIANAQDSVAMAHAFKLAVQAGNLAKGNIREDFARVLSARASSPSDTFWEVEHGEYI